jgi:O-antigen ligase
VYLVFAQFTETELVARAGESFIYQAIWLLMYVILLWHCIAYRRLLAARSSRLFAPVLLAAVGILSLTINDAQPDAIQKFGMFLMTIVFSFLMSAVLTVEKLSRTFLWLGFVTAVIHLALYPVMSGHVQYDPLERTTLIGATAYAGMFAHKNLAGTFFALSVIIGVGEIISGRRGRYHLFELLSLIPQVIALLASGAATPILGLTFSLVAVLALVVSFNNKRLRVLSLMFVLGVSVVAYALREEILLIVGREASLTGRDVIYEQWYPYFVERPLLGYGYSEFFSQYSGRFREELGAGITGWFSAGSFENGYLQVCIDFGLVGFLIYMCIVVCAGRYAIVAAGVKSPSRYTLVGIYAYVVSSSMSLSYIDSHNSLIST